MAAVESILTPKLPSSSCDPVRQPPTARASGSTDGSGLATLWTEVLENRIPGNKTMTMAAKVWETYDDSVRSAIQAVAGTHTPKDIVVIRCRKRRHRGIRAGRVVDSPKGALYMSSAEGTFVTGVYAGGRKQRADSPPEPVARAPFYLLVERDIPRDSSFGQRPMFGCRGCGEARPAPLPEIRRAVAESRRTGQCQEVLA